MLGARIPQNPVGIHSCPQHCPGQGPRHPQGIAIPPGHPAQGQWRARGAGVLPARLVQGRARLLRLIWAMRGGSLQGGFQRAGKQRPDGTQIPARRHPPSQVCTARMLICSREGFSLRRTSAAVPGRHPNSLAGLLCHPPGQVPASRVRVLVQHGGAGRLRCSPCHRPGYCGLISHSQGSV